MSENLQRQIEALGPWFHNLNLHGVRTAPNHFLGDYPTIKWKHFSASLPEDLTGWSVLDIGCNAGFYAMEMKRRGAARVLGIDSEETYLAQARFAAHVMGLDIEFRKLDVYDIDLLHERFDLVLFMGVFYHLRHPLLALDLLHEHVVGRLLVFQSMQRGSAETYSAQDDYAFSDIEHFDDPAFPKMHFIEYDYAGDPTNWWIPNAACCEARLRGAGFVIDAHPEREVYICKRREDAA